MSVTSGSVTVPIAYSDFIPGTYTEQTDDGGLPELQDSGLVTLSFPESTPEPGSLALGAVGASALLAWRRRK
jgi:MYXO-CTERM domain-containing protein